MVARKRQAARLNVQKTVTKDRGTVGKRRSSSSTTLSSPPPSSIDMKVKLPLPGTHRERIFPKMLRHCGPCQALRRAPRSEACPRRERRKACLRQQQRKRPRRLWSHGCTPLKRPAAKVSTEEALVPLHTPLKRPAAQTGPRKAARSMKRPARAGPSDPEAPLHKVTVVTTVKSLPIRSYVQACTATPHGSKRLIAEFSSAQCSNQAELAQKVKATIETERLGYSAARRLREQYLHQQAK